MTALRTLSVEADYIAGERAHYIEAKAAKAKAEDEVMELVIAAAIPALPVIANRIPGIPVRAIEVCEGLYLSENGSFFELERGKINGVSIADVMDRTSPAPVLAVILASIRAQGTNRTPYGGNPKRDGDSRSDRDRVQGWRCAVNGYERIDRIDGKGLITEHFVNPADEDRSLCGLALQTHGTQDPVGNGRCRRCSVIAAMREERSDAALSDR